MSEATVERAATIRKALIDQLAYLVDEVEALKPVVDRVPVPVQEARPLVNDLSIKETYGLIAVLDEQVYLPCLQAMMEDEAPVFDAIDEKALAHQGAWNEASMDTILKKVEQARHHLLAFLHALAPEQWAQAGHFEEQQRDVYALAHYITQHDADLLRSVGYRLHESHLTSRSADLPK